MTGGGGGGGRREEGRRGGGWDRGGRGDSWLVYGGSGAHQPVDSLDLLSPGILSPSAQLESGKKELERSQAELQRKIEHQFTG